MSPDRVNQFSLRDLIAATVVLWALLCGSRSGVVSESWQQQSPQYVPKQPA